MKLPTHIYVYRLRNGSLWADYNYDKAINNELLETWDLQYIDRIIENPGTTLPGRVKALAERVKKDRLFYRNTEVPISNEVLSRSFLPRLKWLFLGR